MRTLIVLGKAHPKQKIGNSWAFTKEEIEPSANGPEVSQAENKQ